MEVMPFIKFTRFVVNPNQITSIVLGDSGESKVIFAGGADSVPLSAQETRVRIPAM